VSVGIVPGTCRPGYAQCVREARDSPLVVIRGWVVSFDSPLGDSGQGWHQQLEKILSLAFLTLFPLIPTFLQHFNYFLASISYVPNFNKLICHLQWGIHLFLANGKVG